MTNPADSTGNVLLIGDTHGDSRFLGNALIEASVDGCETAIQLGDFGFVFHEGSGEETLTHISSFALKAGVKLMFLDGNHENFPELRELGADPSSGEPVTIAPNVVYLPRGSRFTLGKRKVMAFGGAVSIDKEWRVEGMSWWPEELITDEQVDAVSDEPVDVLLSHDVPVMAGGLSNYMVRNDYKLDPLSESNRAKLRKVFDKVKPFEVFHGHYHHSYVTRVGTDWGEADIYGLSCNGDDGSTLLLKGDQ